MSTNSECEFVERNENEWFYILEDYSAPKNSWDWREYAEAWGPFPSEDTALQHLSDNHANPGGWSIITRDEYKEDDLYKQLFEAAQKRGLKRFAW